MKKIITTLILLATCIFILPSCDKTDSNSFGSGSGSENGKGGSLARFIIVGDYLYVVDGNMLQSFSLSQPDNPVKISSLQVGFDIETIFSFQDKLFIGSKSALYIFSIANPAQPALLGQAQHLRACDPVVANDSIAYVTVRSGSTCGGTVNALLIYNIKQIMDPQQRNVVPLVSPYGLGMQDHNLFICDGSAGLKVYDITHPEMPTYKKGFTDAIFYDCIPYGNILICMINGGVAIYDISSIEDMKLLSKIMN